MRVLHVIPSLSALHGGPSRAILQGCAALLKLGVDVTVATSAPRRGVERRLTVPASERGPHVVSFPVTTNLYSTSIPLWRWLRSEAGRFDIVHVHELFTFPSVVGARAALDAGCPYVLTPHGVLMRWGRIHRRPALKRLSITLVESRIVSRAAVVHFTTERERSESLEVVAPARDFTFPLGLDLSEFATPPPRDVLDELFPTLKGKPYALFLSRLHPIKGVETLLRAFALLDSSRGATRLVIAGDGDPAYVRSLLAVASSLGVADRVVFTGFLVGEERLAALASAACLVQPSASESFGVSVVESLAVGVPVVLTDGVALSAEVAAAGAGVAVRRDSRALAEAIGQLIDDPNLCHSMGERGRRLAFERFSVDALALQLRDTYADLARSGA